jgi:hypothetical protein
MSLATGSISSTFGGAASPGFSSYGLGAEATLTQQVLPVPAPPSLLDAISFTRTDNQTSGNKMAVPEAKLRAATQNTSQTWKPADTVRPDSVLKGAEGFAQKHADPKATAAQTMQQNQVSQIKDALKEMSALGGGPVAAVPGGGLSGVAGGAARGFATDALLTAGMTMAFGPVGGIVATGLMGAKAGLEGKGTLVTINETPTYLAAPSLRGSKRDAARSDYGYQSSSPSPAAQANSAPVSNAMQQAMSKGPGFGRADMLGDLQPRMKLSEDSFEQIAIKIAADSPAGKAIKDMKEDSQYAKGVIQSQKNGVDANAQNIADAMDIGIEIPPQGPKLQTFKMA